MYAAPTSSISPLHTINLAKIRKAGDFLQFKEEFRENHHEQFYFTKNDEWESESEIRLLVFGNPVLDEYCSIEDSLEGIHLG